MKEIQLTKGKVAMVSDEDFEYLSQWKWTASLESRGTKWYAIRWARKSEHGDGHRFKVRMHRVIAQRKGELSSFEVVDHIDDNSLNNQRENLQNCTQNENMDRCSNWRGSSEYYRS